MNTTTFDRQLPLRLSIPSTVAIVGVGGVGSWAALFLALAGVPHLQLWDGDEIEQHNLNRFPVGPTFIGANKAAAMRVHIGEVVPHCDVQDNSCMWTPERQLETNLTPDWVLVSTDSLKSRRLVYKWSNECACGRQMDMENHVMLCHVPEAARERRCKYIECSAEGEFGGATGAPATFSTADEANPGYASVPVWVGSAVQGASIACYHILHDSPIPFGNNWRIGWNVERGKFEVQYLGVGSGVLPS